MPRRLFKQEQLERIYKGAIKVLDDMGMKVENRDCLEALEKFGAEVDYPKEKAIFSTAAKNSNKHLGILVANMEHLEQAISDGFIFIAMGVDIRFISKGFKTTLESFEKYL